MVYVPHKHNEPNSNLPISVPEPPSRRYLLSDPFDSWHSSALVVVVASWENVRHPTHFFCSDLLKRRIVSRLWGRFWGAISLNPLNPWLLRAPFVLGSEREGLLEWKTTFDNLLLARLLLLERLPESRTILPRRTSGEIEWPSLFIISVVWYKTCMIEGLAPHPLVHRHQSQQHSRCNDLSAWVAGSPITSIVQRRLILFQSLALWWDTYWYPMTKS